MDDKHFQDHKETRGSQDGASVHSAQRSCSSRSSVGVAAARARAKAEAARARVEFAEREIAIKVDKARLDANLEALHLEKEAAAAIAKAEILEAAAEHKGKDFHSGKSYLASGQGTQERVSDHVKDQATRLSQQSESALNCQHEQQAMHPIGLTSPCSLNALEEDGNQYVEGDACPLPLNQQRWSEKPQTSQIPHNPQSSVQLQERNPPQVKKETLHFASKAQV